MGLTERIELIKKIEEKRKSRAICFLTSLRPNVPSQFADDQVRVLFDHLSAIQNVPISQLDIFLVSNGGSGTVPWRLVSLFREFSKKFAVLIPYRAYSAATLLALGADDILMGPFAELGPIDPTVSNEYNPTDPQTQQRLGISVEDVKAYVNFIKSTVGITHEDELIKAIEILAEKVHPLALGNVERFLSQSRLIARKILRTHMTEEADAHTIEEIIENMASKLYFHGHPINRQEARTELHLKVKEKTDPELEALMWKLYLEYESEFKNTSIFNPLGDLGAKRAIFMEQIRVQTEQISQTQAQMIQILQQLLQAAAAPGGNPAQATQLQQQLAQYQQSIQLGIQSLQQLLQIQQSNPIVIEEKLIHVMIESGTLSSAFMTENRFELTLPPPGVPPQLGQQAVRQDIISQGWSHSPVPAA